MGDFITTKTAVQRSGEQSLCSENLSPSLILCKYLLNSRKTHLPFTTFSNPETQGQGDRLKTLEVMLRKYATKAPSAWATYMSLAEFCDKSSNHKSTDKISFSRVYVKNPRRVLDHVM
jgi:hypothetical protein